MQDELCEDPHDFIASHLVRMSERFSADAQFFTALYLLVHGVVGNHGDARLKPGFFLRGA